MKLYTCTFDRISKSFLYQLVPFPRAYQMIIYHIAIYS